MFIALPLLDAGSSCYLVPVDFEFLLENAIYHFFGVFAVIFEGLFQHQRALLGHFVHYLVGQLWRERFSPCPLHALVWEQIGIVVFQRMQHDVFMARAQMVFTRYRPCANV